jgi:hypothetical protein
MVKYMEKLVMGSTPAAELNVEERNLLFVAHRVVVAAAWHIVSSIEQKGGRRLPRRNPEAAAHMYDKAKSNLCRRRKSRDERAQRRGRRRKNIRERERTEENARKIQ